MSEWITRKRIDFIVWRLRRKAGKTKPVEEFTGLPYRLPLQGTRVWACLNEKDQKTWELARTAQYLLDNKPLPPYDLTGREVSEEQMQEVIDRDFGLPPSFVENEVRTDERRRREETTPYEATRLVSWWDSGIDYEGKYGTVRCQLKLINGVPDARRPLLAHEVLALDKWNEEHLDAETN